MIVHRENVVAVLAVSIGVTEASLADSVNFIDDLGSDSLDGIEAVRALEDSFDIVITDEEAENIRTVGDAVKMVIERAKDDERADSSS